ASQIVRRLCQAAWPQLVFARLEIGLDDGAEDLRILRLRRLLLGNDILAQPCASLHLRGEHAHLLEIAACHLAQALSTGDAGDVELDEVVGRSTAEFADTKPGHLTVEHEHIALACGHLNLLGKSLNKPWHGALPRVAERLAERLRTWAPKSS